MQFKRDWISQYPIYEESLQINIYETTILDVD
jgi:hypothetical protein